MLRNLLFTRYSVKTCELSCPKSTRKVSGLLRNARHVTHVTLGNDMLQATCHLCISQFQLRPSPPPGQLRGICAPCQSLGWGISKFGTAWGSGICLPRGYPQGFDTRDSDSKSKHGTWRILSQRTSSSSQIG